MNLEILLGGESLVVQMSHCRWSERASWGSWKFIVGVPVRQISCVPVGVSGEFVSCRLRELYQQRVTVRKAKNVSVHHTRHQKKRMSYFSTVWRRGSIFSTCQRRSVLVRPATPDAVSALHCAGRIGKLSGGFWKVLFPNSYENLSSRWISPSRPQVFNLFSYRCGESTFTALVKSYLTGPQKSNLYQKIPNLLPIFLPQC